MRYPDGNLAKVGDTVELWNGFQGTIVCSIDDNVFGTAFPKDAWDYLISGVLIMMDNSQVYHYTEADEDIRLIWR